MASDTATLKEKLAAEKTRLGDGFRAAVEQIDPVKKVQDLYSDLPEMPLVKGVSMEDIGDSYKQPEESKFDKMLQKLTGFSTGDFHLGKLGNYLADKLSSLWDLLVHAFKQCIKKWLDKLMRKFPLLALILNLDAVIGQFLGKYKRLAEDWIDEQIKNILYRKLQIQQLEAFNKKITDAIRNLCGPYQSSKRTRDYANDFSDAEYDISAQVTVLAEVLKTEAASQSSGYPARSVDMFVNSDGTIKTAQQRLTETTSSLSTLLSGPGSRTLEQNVAVKSLINEINELKLRDTESVNC